MPSTITPPEIDRHRISDGNNGHRPPTDKRTGGNGEGDGDNWNNRPRGHRGPAHYSNSGKEFLPQWSATNTFNTEAE